MRLPAPPLIGTIRRRYKRFLADVELGGEVVTAHVPNTGSMATCWEAGWPALVTESDSPGRKLRHTLEMTHNGEGWIGVNTSRPNRLAAEAIGDGTVAELAGFASMRREVRSGASRIDLLLTDGPPDGHGRCLVEVKNVTLLARGRRALFPDSPSERGRRHLRELLDARRGGGRAAILFVVQREDADSFAPADAIDPEYGRLLRRAGKEGVEVLAYGCRVSPEEIRVVRRLPVHGRSDGP